MSLLVLQCPTCGDSVHVDREWYRGERECRFLCATPPEEVSEAAPRTLAQVRHAVAQMPAVVEAHPSSGTPHRIADDLFLDVLRLTAGGSPDAAEMAREVLRVVADDGPDIDWWYE